MSKLTVVVGGQYGSEGKGAIAGYLAKGKKDLTAIRVGGPNAGHTVYDNEGKEYKLQQIPVAAVTNLYTYLDIAPGSEIDIAILEREIRMLEKFNVRYRLKISNNATILSPDYGKQEAELIEQIGSTGKGVGAARAARILRKAEIVRHCPFIPEFMKTNTLRLTDEIMIEGTQGYGLGLYTKNYPFVTSGGCTAIDFMAQAKINPWEFDEVEIWVVLRTFPIRVAGNSGPMKNEMTWEDMSKSSGGYIKPEHTTVTNKIRRIGLFDYDLARAAIRANGGPDHVKVALTFLDYEFPDEAGVDFGLYLSDAAKDYVVNMEEAIGTGRIDLIGTGPRSIIDRRANP